MSQESRMNSLQQHKSKLLILLSMTLTFLGCSTPMIEKKYDEIEKKTTCRLSNFRVRGPINVSLDASDSENANLLFSVNSFGYLTNMHQDPKVLFKVHNAQTVQELSYQGSSKNWLAESYKQYKENKTFPFTPHSTNPYNHDYASIKISKSDFLKIAQAERVEFFVQTNSDPVKAEFLKEDLEYFRTFHKTCF